MLTKVRIVSFSHEQINCMSNVYACILALDQLKPESLLRVEKLANKELVYMHVDLTNKKYLYDVFEMVISSIIKLNFKQYFRNQ